MCLNAFSDDGDGAFGRFTPSNMGRDREAGVVIDELEDHAFATTGQHVFMVLLPEPKDLLDLFSLGCVRYLVGCAGAIPKAHDAFGLEVIELAVICLTVDAVVTAGRCDVAADFFDLAQDGELVVSATVEFTLGRGGESMS